MNDFFIKKKKREDKKFKNPKKKFQKRKRKGKTIEKRKGVV